MSDARKPFGEFCREAMLEWKAGLKGAAHSPKMIEEAYDRIHDAFHKARKGRAKPKVAPTNEAERIYELYPRKVARPVALKAIVKALNRLPFDLLSERVKLFASYVARWPAADKPQSIPHPTTFFNQERFNDQPETWERPGMKSVQVVKVALPTIHEPRDWREIVAREFSDTSVLGQLAASTAKVPWEKLSRSTQENIVKVCSP